MHFLVSHVPRLLPSFLSGSEAISSVHAEQYNLMAVKIRVLVYTLPWRPWCKGFHGNCLISVPRHCYHGNLLYSHFGETKTLVYIGLPWRPL